MAVEARRALSCTGQARKDVGTSHQAPPVAQHHGEMCAQRGTHRVGPGMLLGIWEHPQAFTLSLPPLDIVVRSLFMYLVVLIGLRLAGKRKLGR